MSEMSLLQNCPFEKVILSNGGNSLILSQGLPEDLRAAYKEVRTLCGTMDTRLYIHGYAREHYERVYQLGELCLNLRRQSSPAVC